MRWHDWRIWRLAYSKACRADTYLESNLSWRHLGSGFYWATQA